MGSEIDNSKLIVNYLPHSLSDEGFKAMFQKIGPVQNCKLMKTREGQSLAYGFVEYSRPEHGVQAIATYNGMQKEGKTVKVAIAKPKHMRETTNLYVADLPEQATETAVRELFEQYGEVNNCKVVVNPETGLSRGFAFVLFSVPSEADQAIRGLNGTIFPETNKMITVKIKDEPKSSNPDLYIANVPKNMKEETLQSYFAAYGEVRTCKIVTDTNTGASKGIAFVHFSKRKESEDAIAGLHDTRLPGSTQNLIVKYKVSKEEKGQDQYSQYDMSAYWGGMAGGMGGSMPAAHPMDDSSGYTREEMVTSPTGQVKRIIHHYVSVPAAPEDGLPERENGGGPMRRQHGVNRYNPTAVTARPQPPLPPPGAGSPIPAPMAYPPNPYSALYSHEAAKNQPSHQLFVFNLGAEADDAALYDLFAPFGAVTKVFPMRDPSTKQCKGFGFVEMPDYNAAVAAIQALNGMPYKHNEMKTLKVDFKTQSKK